MKRLVVDLDHTLCTPGLDEDQGTDPSVRYVSARPNVEMIRRLREYRELGFEIVINTSRNMRTYNGDIEAIRTHTLPIILEWLALNNVPYDEVVVGKPWCGFDGFYVDDRAIRPSEFRTQSYEELIALIAKEHV